VVSVINEESNGVDKWHVITVFSRDNTRSGAVSVVKTVLQEYLYGNQYVSLCKYYWATKSWDIFSLFTANEEINLIEAFSLGSPGGMAIFTPRKVIENNGICKLFDKDFSSSIMDSEININGAGVTKYFIVNSGSASRDNNSVYISNGGIACNENFALAEEIMLSLVNFDLRDVAGIAMPDVGYYPESIGRKIVDV